MELNQIFSASTRSRSVEKDIIRFGAVLKDRPPFGLHPVLVPLVQWQMIKGALHVIRYMWYLIGLYGWYSGQS